MKTVTITLQIPDGVAVTVSEQSAGATFSAPAAASPDHLPQCPTHGPMVYHAAGMNKAGTKMLSASYRCDHVSEAGDFCATKPVWMK